MLFQSDIRHACDNHSYYHTGSSRQIGPRDAPRLNERDGILGEYSLHILQPPWGGRGWVFWVSSDLNSGKKVSFSFSGGGGVFWVSSDLNSGMNVRVFHLGVLWVSSDLNSGKKVRVFHLGGRCSG